MPADNPVSWFFLLILGIYGVCKFFSKVMKESERLKAERQRAVEEFFAEKPLDKINIQAYNNYINKKGNDYHERNDGRY
jgi:hypothetical protein